MEYNTFLNQIAAQIRSSLSDRSVRLIQVQKNNGLLLDGLCIETPGEAISPTIYLNPYYQEYQKGRPLPDICLAILETYRTRRTLPSCPPSRFLDFSSIQDRIVFRLVHADANRRLLEQIPFVPVLDLAMVFSVFLAEDGCGQTTALVRSSHLERWQVSAEELYRRALVNTPLLLPASIDSLSSVMAEILETIGESGSVPLSPDLSRPEETYETPLYVLTNRTGIYGASCILYPEPLKNFADSRGADVIILPSSVHEVLITADTPEMDYEALSRMVCEINCSDVPLEDRLSNQVYRYSRRSGELTIVSHAPGSIERSNP